MTSQVHTEAFAGGADCAPPAGADSAPEAEGCRGDRYAVVVVLEAESPEAAWEALRGTVGNLEGGEEPDCIHIGAPWRGIPADAEDLSTDHLELGMFVPNGGGFVPLTAVLRACE
ncbi:MAG TPA: hypothetical protein VFI09_09745 [Solirubrobacterales bacterium]|nr:hypothetical protein [Solirubrobacterales bacterium]